jgi:WD40 repeat protein
MAIFNGYVSHYQSWSPHLWLGDRAISTTYRQDGNFLATNSMDNTVRIWDVRPFAGQRTGGSGQEAEAWTIELLYGYGSIPMHTIFRGMNIHLPAILRFTRGTSFWPIAIFLVATFFANFDDELTSVLNWQVRSFFFVLVSYQIIGSGTWITYGPMMTTGNSCNTDFLWSLKNMSPVNT